MAGSCKHGSSDLGLVEGSETHMAEKEGCWISHIKREVNSTSIAHSGEATLPTLLAGPGHDLLLNPTGRVPKPVAHCTGWSLYRLASFPQCQAEAEQEQQG